MNKRQAEKLERYFRATAAESSETDEVKKLRRDRLNIRFRIHELKTRWELAAIPGQFDRTLDEDEAKRLEGVVKQIELDLTDLGASF